MILINCTYADVFIQNRTSVAQIRPPIEQGPLLELALTTISSVNEGVQVDSVSAAGSTADGQVSPVEHPDLLA